MSQTIISLEGALEDELERMFKILGPTDYVIKHFVGLVDGKLRAEIRADEHPPPHFHVRYDDEDASYCLMTGKRLPNVHGLERYDKTVYFWWKRNFEKLVIKWNSTRPGDCPVGEIILASQSSPPAKN